MIVTVLFSGSACRYDGVTVFVPGGDVSSTTTVPPGMVMITRMLYTLVAVPVTATEKTMGVIPSANGMITYALVLVKVTPAESGLRSDG